MRIQINAHEMVFDETFTGEVLNFCAFQTFSQSCDSKITSISLLINDQVSEEKFKIVQNPATHKFSSSLTVSAWTRRRKFATVVEFLISRLFPSPTNVEEVEKTSRKLFNLFTQSEED
jgi:hypothetical protein